MFNWFFVDSIFKFVCLIHSNYFRLKTKMINILLLSISLCFSSNTFRFVDDVSSWHCIALCSRGTNIYTHTNHNKHQITEIESKQMSELAIESESVDLGKHVCNLLQKWLHCPSHIRRRIFSHIIQFAMCFDAMYFRCQWHWKCSRFVIGYHFQD